MTYMKMAQVFPNETIIQEESVFRLLDKAIIPFAEGNRDYEQYLAWLEEGNSPIDFDINVLQNN